MIERLCIIGTGLIGGSLARALREAGQCREVVGCSRNPAHLQQAVDLGVIDRFDTDPVQAVAGADMVLVAVPLGAMEAIFTTLRGHLGADTVITDVGSAKAGVVEAARRGFGELPPGFVPGHPIAGTEQSGVAASFPELFRDRPGCWHTLYRDGWYWSNGYFRQCNGLGVQLYLHDSRWW